MSIILQDITEDNWKEAIKLSVKADQQNFVAPNVYTIAQSKFTPDDCYFLKGFFVDGNMVGFSWFGHDDEDNTYWIARLMIDKDQQGKGYGRAALLKILELMKDPKELFPSEDPAGPQATEVYISAIPENVSAKNLYKTVGFEKTGKIIHGEEQFRLVLQ